MPVTANKCSNSFYSLHISLSVFQINLMMAGPISTLLNLFLRWTILSRERKICCHLMNQTWIFRSWSLWIRSLSQAILIQSDLMITELPDQDWRTRTAGGNLGCQTWARRFNHLMICSAMWLTAAMLTLEQVLPAPPDKTVSSWGPSSPSSSTCGHNYKCEKVM